MDRSVGRVCVHIRANTNFSRAALNLNLGRGTSSCVTLQVLH